MFSLLRSLYLRRTVAIFISFTLFVNLTVEGFSQVFSQTLPKDNKELNISLDKMQEKFLQAKNSPIIDTYSNLTPRSYEGDAIQKRLKEIQLEVFTKYIYNPAHDLGNQTPQEKLEFGEFYSKYKANIKSEFSKTSKLLDKEYQKNREEIDAAIKQYPDLEGKRQQSYNELDTWHKSANEILSEQLTNALSNVKQDYDAYSREYDSLLEESYQELLKNLRALINEYFSIYKKNKNKAADTVLWVSSDLLTHYPLTDNIFTDEQINILLSLFRNKLEENSKRCLKEGRCNLEIASIYGLSVLSKDSAAKGPDAYLIENFMSKALSSPASTQVASIGFASILSMEAYEAARSFLAFATSKEQKTETPDILSFQTPVKNRIERKGSLLGPLSQNGQYSTEEGETGNIWYDIALMLSEDGSPKSLEMLRTFGVEKCEFILDKSLLGKEKGFIIECNGIAPFLAGALAGGKSGAEKYTLPIKMKGEQFFLEDGSIETVNENKALKSQRIADTSKANLDAYAAREGLDRAAVIAKYFIDMHLSDVPADEEKLIDTSILGIYPQIQKASLGKYAVIDDARFTFAERSYKQAKLYLNLAKGADIIFTIACFYDLGLLGARIYNIIKLSRLKGVSRMVFLKNNIVAFQKIKAKRIKRLERFNSFKNHIKIAAPDLPLFTNAGSKLPKPFLGAIGLAGGAKVLNPIAVKNITGQALAFAEAAASKPASGILTGAVIDKALKAVTYDSKAGAFKMEESLMSSNEGKQIHNILNGALARINTTYQHGGLTNVKGSVYRQAVGTQIKSDFIRSKIETSAVPGFIKKIEKTKELNFVPSGISARATNGKIPLTIYNSLKGTVTPAPVYFDVTKKISGIKTKNMASVILATKKNGSAELHILTNDGSILKPSFFKLPIPASQIKTFAEYSLESSSYNPLRLKLTPAADNFSGLKNIWDRNLSRFISKEKQFAAEGELFLERNGQHIRTNLRFSTNKKYQGIHSLIRNDGAVGLVNADKGLLIKDGSFNLPKRELGNFAKLLENSSWEKLSPLNMSIGGSLNKMSTLNYTSFISLSAASTSLASPLAENFEKIDEKQATLITLSFPYLASLFSPLITPFVKRYGATKLLAGSMATASAATLIPIFFGYHGGGHIHRGNPDNPSIYPLYVSAALIGVASALTRSSFTPLITEVGGKSNTLKSMAFKSLSAFVMIAPPLFFQMPGYIRGNYNQKTYYTKPDGSYYFSSTGKPIEKQYLDFSFAYPILAAMSGLAAYKIMASKFPSDIGRIKNYKFASLIGDGTKTGALASMRGVLKEGGRSSALLFKKADILVPTATAFMMTGAESSILFKYSQKRSDEYIRASGVNNIFVPLLATATVAATGFGIRIASKSVTKVFGGEANPATLRRIFGFSLGTAALGGGLMYGSKDNPAMFYTGLALASLGFANATNSMLLIGTDNLAAKFSKDIITSYKTTFPISQLGLAAVPMVFSGNADRMVENDKSLSRNDALQKNLWMPMASMGAAGILAARTTGILKKANLAITQLATDVATSFKNAALILPAGTVGITKGLVDGYSVNGINPAAQLPPTLEKATEILPYNAKTSPFLPQPNVNIKTPSLKVQMPSFIERTKQILPFNAAYPLLPKLSGSIKAPVTSAQKPQVLALSNH